MDARESYLYVGLAPLVLVIVALTRVRRPGIAIWALLGTGGLIIALGQYSPIDVFWLLWKVPGLGWLRAPSRFELLVVLALAMLAAHGMAMLQARVRLPAPGLASVCAGRSFGRCSCPASSRLCSKACTGR